MSPTITIPKTKYESLKEQARAYELLKQAVVRGGFFDVPSTRKTDRVIRAFRGSGLYNRKFLKSFEQGLKRSAYFS